MITSPFSVRYCRHRLRLTRSLAHPAIHRDSRFKQISAADINHFRQMLGDTAVVTNQDDLQPYNVDWMHRFQGASNIALRPATTEQVSQVMRYCNENQIAVVPQGGNTGLVGGSVPVFDELILSLSAMNRIEDFDEDSGVVTTQAGVVLETLDSFVGAAGYRVPLDLGAKGSCQIGGNVATNAGGSRFVRYGPLRASVVGMEAVLPDGRVFDAMTRIRKDNTGYDLKQLMIGAEGTLGIITRLAIACPMKSSSVDTMIVHVTNSDHVPPLLRLAKQSLGEVLSAIEFMDSSSVHMADTHLSHVSDPLSIPHEPQHSLVLIECAGSNAEHNREKLEAFLEAAFEQDLVSDGVIAESETQSNELWELRESLPEAVLKAGSASTLKYDVSVPVSHFHRMIDSAKDRVKDLTSVQVCGWGHIGDENLHLNVAIQDIAEKDSAQQRLEPWVYEYVSGVGGSISAEHGLGVMKAADIGYSKGDVAVDIMRTMKSVLDVNGICNPYKVLPTPSE
ncbi:D-lactate dehydrogenase (cytochrome) [Gracilaria domingensis]|nr:D-lactate dehydrogenase (cytochrome) [Gracilaria domingensis]